MTVLNHYPVQLGINVLDIHSKHYPVDSSFLEIEVFQQSGRVDDFSEFKLLPLLIHVITVSYGIGTIL